MGNCLSEKEVTNICRQYLKKYWNEELVIPIKIDGRLKNSLGYFRHYGDNPGVIGSMEFIKFSKNLFIYYSDKEIKQVMLHELTHYVLYKRGIKEYRDAEEKFEKELKRVDAISTKKLRHHGKAYRVYCPHCSIVIGETISKKNATSITNKYLCHCGSELAIEEYIR